MKTTKFTAIVLSLALSAITAFAGPVTVMNVTASQRPTDPIVDIYYDLLNPSGGLHNVSIELSTNSGAWYVVWDSAYVSGDVGAGIITGRHKQIVWNAAADVPYCISPFAHVRVRANEENIPWRANGMALIPAGSFTMGDSFGEATSSERPTHSVYLSAFYMDKYEVSKTKWDEVYSWAITNGYSFVYAGDGKAATHPVQFVSWCDCVKWCNARSQKEGRTPFYYVDAGQTVVYKTGQSNIWNGAVKWNANGYRLPTEAEWEKAARGGAAGHRFPWSDADTISQSRANYLCRTNAAGQFLYSYDLGPTPGYHPTFATGGSPYTSPVGYFAANGYGLYDMAGNAYEWCWDWYLASYYSTSPSTDPHGSESGTSRVMRSGSWLNGYPYICRVAYRGVGSPGSSNGDVGFRCVRGL